MRQSQQGDSDEMKALMAESCCLWRHSETGRVLVITGEGCNELSIPGWNRLVMNDDKTAMIIDQDTDEDGDKDSLKPNAGHVPNVHGYAMPSQRRQQIKDAMTAMERVATFEKPNCIHRAAYQQLQNLLQAAENKVFADARKTMERKLLSDGGE